MNREQGFSIIELLVTIGIVGILSSMSAAIFTQYKGNAYDAQALSELQSYITAQEIYANDNHNVYAMGPIQVGLTFSPDIIVGGGFLSSTAGFGYSISLYHDLGASTFCYTNELAGVNGAPANLTTSGAIHRVKGRVAPKACLEE